MRIDEKAIRGQKLRTETSPDKSSHMVDQKEALVGRKCGGGPTDVSHSLSGAGMVETYNDKSGVGGKKSKGGSGY